MKEKDDSNGSKSWLACFIRLALTFTSVKITGIQIGDYTNHVILMRMKQDFILRECLLEPFSQLKGLNLPRVD